MPYENITIGHPQGTTIFHSGKRTFSFMHINFILLDKCPAKSNVRILITFLQTDDYQKHTSCILLTLPNTNRLFKPQLCKNNLSDWVHLWPVCHLAKDRVFWRNEVSGLLFNLVFQKSSLDYTHEKKSSFSIGQITDAHIIT